MRQTLTQLSQEVELIDVCLQFDVIYTPLKKKLLYFSAMGYDGDFNTD